MRLVKPKKFLGQHFLKDLKVAQDIADTVDAVSYTHLRTYASFMEVPK